MTDGCWEGHCCPFLWIPFILIGCLLPREERFLSQVWERVQIRQGFPGGTDSKESAFNEEDPGSVPEWGRSPGEGNSNPFQYSCLENRMDKGAWWATVHGVTKSQTRLKQLSMQTCRRNRTTGTVRKLGRTQRQGFIQTPSFVMCSWGYKVELKSNLHAAWQALCPCDSVPKESIPWAGKGLAFLRSKGDVFLSSCLLLVGSEPRWRKWDVMGGWPEHPSTRSEGFREICPQTVYSCQNECAFIKNVFTGS